VNGACREYEKRCEEYEQVCKAGYKKACKNVVRPFDDIKNELTWLVYQEYMSQLGDENGGPLSDYFTTRLQEFYKTDLRVIRISKGKGLGGEGNNGLYPHQISRFEISRIAATRPQVAGR